MLIDTSKRTLFLDLDGFLADFDTDYHNRFGCWPWDERKEVKWKNIEACGQFFQSLPPMEGALDFYRSVAHYQHIVLTGCPHTNYESSAAQKRAWARQWLGPDVMVLPVKGSSTKPMFMNHPLDVLVDDRADVCNLWHLHGGTALHYTGNYSFTLEQVHQAMTT